MTGANASKGNATVFCRKKNCFHLYWLDDGVYVLQQREWVSQLKNTDPKYDVHMLSFFFKKNNKQNPIYL